ncbi:hypothetical protein PDQ75_25000 [Bacillus cereus group sp. Bc015]|uniref:hypothetical protein n=1 Tax=Bacillus cereus group sp. Bc015 TaxID=3018123 RepID=UPI0022E30FC0|nr:hypothetical protein [Bacillus cereus group sp. Bc015]MDA2738415.1 hypothetical protein [Bacillus cereus group sp. Bc015]
MKKKLVVAGMTVMSIGMLAGCTQQTVLFEGKEMSIKRAESLIENRLEIENEADYDVNITVEEDNSKTKKRGKSK